MASNKRRRYAWFENLGMQRSAAVPKECVYTSPSSQAPPLHRCPRGLPAQSALYFSVECHRVRFLLFKFVMKSLVVLLVCTICGSHRSFSSSSTCCRYWLCFLKRAEPLWSLSNTREPKILTGLQYQFSVFRLRILALRNTNNAHNT